MTALMGTSGAGKTTLVRHLMEQLPVLQFSVSATSREKRDHEIHGKDYFFLSPEQFRAHIHSNDFLEWDRAATPARSFFG